jgi:autotransporter strand-loop-strand O-heptosyltransferase
MKDLLIKEYNNTKILNIKTKEPQNIFKVNFVDGASLEITGPIQEEYKILFTDLKTNKVVHESIITNNMWTRTNIKYCVDWKIETFKVSTNEKVFEYVFNPKGKRVYIHLDSKAIGDTLAWFPYAEEFRKKWNCDVISSTFHNDWFKKEYPEIEFVTPGTEVTNLYAMFNIGWFYDGQEIVTNKIPIDFKKHPLQQTASEILNLEYKEVKPKVKISNKKTNINENYVVIAPHASSHAKYWMYPKGWQTVIDYLNNNGYKVVMITGEPLGDEWHDSKLGGTLYGVVNKTGYNIDISERMIDIRDAKLFIGVGSGLSWLSWAIGTPTVLISGFSYPYTEFLDCERIFNNDANICAGCFNKHWLNPGDWEWCPEHKDTPRHFECTKTIKPEQVITSINKLLNIY